MAWLPHSCPRLSKRGNFLIHLFSGTWRLQFWGRCRGCLGRSQLLPSSNSRLTCWAPRCALKTRDNLLISGAGLHLFPLRLLSISVKQKTLLQNTQYWGLISKHHISISTCPWRDEHFCSCRFGSPFSTGPWMRHIISFRNKGNCDWKELLHHQAVELACSLLAPLPWPPQVQSLQNCPPLS